MSNVKKANLRIDGRETWLVPFSCDHLKDPAYIGWLRNPNIVRTLNLPHYLNAPVPFEEVEAYCNAVMTSATDLFLALHYAEDDSFIGTVKAGYIDSYAGTADIGIMIGRQDLWGRGLASDALAGLCGYLLGPGGLRRLTAGVMAVNPGMIRVFKKLGFVQEGVFRQQDRIDDGYCDHIHLGCLKTEFINVGP